jgi:hypothetical protein
MSLQSVPHLANAARPSNPLVERLEHFVNARTNGMIRHLEVSVVDSDVIISGKANTYYTKQLATHAILDLVQGCSLTNNIEVG